MPTGGEGEGVREPAPPRVLTVPRIGIPFLLLSVLLVAYAVRQAVREPWMGDFWGHAAVVRELATHPWSPSHPELGIDAPHAFISPWSLLVAAISRLAGVDAVRALGIAGVLDLLVLLAGIRLFVERVCPGRGARASFYALLFTLLLWGRSPWVYSGVFNLLSLGYVLPYASAFAAGVALLAAAFWARRLPAPGPGTVVVAALAAGFLLVTHPPAWCFLLAAMAAFVLAARGGRRAWIGFLIAAAASAGLAALWPYYPVLELVASGQSAFHASNKFMYERVLSRAFPALLALPLAAWSLRARWRNPLLLSAAALAVIYVYGQISRAWNFGRSLPWLIFLAHAQIASSLAAAEDRWISSPALRRLAPLVVTAACVAFAFWWQVRPVFEVAETDKDVRKELGFLATATGQYDVVLADFDTGWYVPAFGGKVIASRHPVAFVASHQDRVRDVQRFFTAGPDRAGREAIIARWGARFVLLDRKRPESADVEPGLRPLGEAVVDDGRWLLIRVRP